MGGRPRAGGDTRVKLFKHPLLPFGLIALIGLHYAIPHAHHGVSGIVVHMVAGMLAVLALILHIRNQLRPAEASAGTDAGPHRPPTPARSKYE